MRAAVKLAVPIALGLLIDANAQTFVQNDVAAQNVSPVQAGATTWGDYDQDGDLDLFVTGEDSVGNALSALYENSATGQLLPVATDIIDLESGTAAWADYDNDGDLDLLITGQDSSTALISKIFQNNAGTFVEAPVVLPGLSRSCAAWFDFNLDGRLDFFVSGLDANNVSTASVFLNQGDGNFSDAGLSLTGLSHASCAAADFDNDGDFDLVVAGEADGGAPAAQLLINQNGTALSANNAGIVGLSDGAVALGDYDQDGDQDILLAGLRADSTRNTRLYRNDGGLVFTEILTNLPGLNSGSAQWGDLDNDGDLDLLLSGLDDSGVAFTSLHENTGAGTFLTVGEQITGAADGSATWADFENDGDLDFMVVGRNQSGALFAALYANGVLPPNAAPAIPAGLSSSFSTNGLLLQWQPAVDGTTPQSALTYNLRVGSAAGSADIIAPMSNPNGFRQLVASGNLQNATSFLIPFDQARSFQEIFWSVQTVDNGYVGSAFADEQIFSPSEHFSLTIAAIGGGSVTINPVQDFYEIGTPVTLTATAFPGFAFKSWGGDTTSTENPLTIIMTADRSLAATFVKQFSLTLDTVGSGSVQTSPAGTLFDIGTQVTLTATASAGFRFGDWSGDLISLDNPVVVTMDTNKVITASFIQQFTLTTNTIGSGDVALSPAGPAFDTGTLVQALATASPGFEFLGWSGALSGLTNPDSVLMDSDKTLTATFRQLPFLPDESASLALPGVNASNAAWGDYDNDGDLDILISGQNLSNVRIAKIFRNDAGAFTDAFSLPGMAASFADWGDFNNDGFLDILLIGFDAASQSRSFVYQNAGDGTFFDTESGLAGAHQGSAAWGDYDRDGDLDILVTGASTSAGSVSDIYRNDAGSFVKLQAGLTPVTSGFGKWADFDKDGDLDILLAGAPEGVGSTTQIYRNDGAGTFVLTPVTLTPVATSAAALGDYDNDGDMDILLAGSSATGRVTKVIRNDGAFTFTVADTTIIGVSNGSVAWGDFDNDGLLDVLVAGFDSQFSRVARVYKNQGDGTFTDIDAELDGIIFGSACWTDFDNDHDLDIFLTGSSASTRVAKLYRNTSLTSNTRPQLADKLTSTFTNESVSFFWPAASDEQTPAAGLTYNLRIGTTPGASDLLPSMSLPSGFRQIVRSGNMDHALSFTLPISNILDLPGVYWSVQAIDNTFAGSAFTEEASLAPQILSVTDVPNDQGQRVTVKWKASALDHDVNHLTSYSVWRALPENLTSTPTAVLSKAELSETRYGVETIRTTLSADGQTLAWEWLATLPAQRRPLYAFTAPTLFDSMATTNGRHFFLVAAHTDDANIFFDSVPDSGASRDNLPPATPANLAGTVAQGTLSLQWQGVADPDLKQYALYGSDSPNISLSENEPFSTTTDTFFVGTQQNLADFAYFIVAAQDSSGNLSEASNEISLLVTSVTGPDAVTPARFALFPNFPNPFNPSTQIRFSLANDANVKLTIFNIRGATVATLLNERRQAGEHVVSFDARNLPSGPYFYKLQAGRLVEVRKMLFLK